MCLASAGCRQSAPVFSIDLIKFLDNSYTASFQQSLQEGLDAAGLRKGTDYWLRTRAAQGDMATLTLLVDAAKTDRTNLLITFQAPTLFTAMQRAPDVP